MELASGRGSMTRRKGQDAAWPEPSVNEECVGTAGRQARLEHKGWCGGNRQRWKKRNKECLPSILILLVLWENGETLSCKLRL